MKIITLTVLDENGKGYTFAGSGTFNVIKTRVEVEGRPPTEWPEIAFANAHLLVVPQVDE